MKKGQSSIEFMTFVGVAIVLLLLFIGVSVFYSRLIAQQELAVTARDLTLILKSEIDLASTVENGYSRTIRLPATLDGKNYIFALGDTGQSTAREVFTELDGNQFSEILAVDISGFGVSYELTDQKQFLTIVKNNNQVMIQKSS